MAGDLNGSGPGQPGHPVDIMNAKSLEARLTFVEQALTGRITFLENEVATLKQLVMGMQQTVAVAMHEVRGSKATIPLPDDDGS